MPDPHSILASDTVNWLQCRRRVWFDHNPPLSGTMPMDAFAELIKLQGEAHEMRVLEKLVCEGEVIEAESAAHTRELMVRQIPVIYQPIIESDQPRIIAKPDFLLWRGEAGYQVADAKLARSLKNHKDIMIQLGLYRRLFKTQLPALAYLGLGHVAEVGDEINDEIDRFLSDMERLLASETAPAVRYSYSKCSLCPWLEHCLPQFEQQQDISLLYGIDSRAVAGLAAVGIDSISRLAGMKPGDIPDVPWLKGDIRKQRAILQAQSFLDGQPRIFRPLDLPEGTWVHFDLESNPLDPAGDQVYLWGLFEPPYLLSSFNFHWSDKVEDDYKTWLDFLEHVGRLREQFPDLLLVHYAQFEVQKIRAYAERYDMLEDKRVRWLLGANSPLFDLSRAVQESLILPLRSYGLKAICKAPELVNFQWELEESGSQWSVVRYLDFQQASNEAERIAIKNEILCYNRDDVRATRALELWLRALSDQAF